MFSHSVPTKIQSWYGTKYIHSHLLLSTLFLCFMRVISTAFITSTTTNIQLFDFRWNKYTNTHIVVKYIIEKSLYKTPIRRQWAAEKLSRFCSSRKFPFINSILFTNWTNIVLILPKKVHILSIYIEHLRCVFARSFSTIFHRSLGTYYLCPYYYYI